MALVIDDRVRETTTVTGTNDATLLGAVTGFQAFSVIGDGNTTFYTISDQSGGNWEVGIGTFSAIGPTLARTTVLSSSAGGAKVSFPAGTKDVFITYPSDKAVYLDASNNVQPALGDVNATTVDTTNLEVTNLKAKDGTAAGSIANSTGVVTLASSVLTTTDINGGTIDGTTIGGASAAAGNFTTLGATGVATFSAGTVSAPAITTTGDTNTGIFFPAADTIAFTEGGVESMRIDSVGNVGIGTASPSFVSGYGGVQISGVGGNSSILKLTNSTTGTTSTDGFELILGNTSSDAYVWQRESAPLIFGTANTERMRILANGDIETKGGVVYFGASNTGDIFVSPSVGSMFIEYPTAHALVFRTQAGTENMRIVGSSGNVGIGTSSPTGRLTVSGASGSNLDVIVGVNSSTAVTDGKSVGFLLRGSDTAGTLKDAGAIRSVPSSETYANAALTFSSRGGDVLTEQMRITGAGNVGIGITSSSARLTVHNASSIGEIGRFSSAQGTGEIQLNLGFTINNQLSMFYNIANGDGGLSTNVGSSNLIFRTVSAERMRIDFSGNVGIGTSSPAFNLDVNANTNSSLARVHVRNTNSGSSASSLFSLGNDGGNGQANLLLSSSTNSTFGANNLVLINSVSTGTLQFWTNNAERMRIASGGNVGIGTTDPQANLQVGASSDTGIAMSNSSSVTSGNRGTISMYNSGVSTVGYIRFGAVTDDVGTDIQFANRPAGGSLTERMRIDSTGNVGIGTTNPNMPVLIVRNWVSGKATLGIQPTISFASGGLAGIGLFDSDNSRAGYMYSDTSGTYLFNDKVSPIIFGTNGGGGTVERMRISSDGNLFVGRTSDTDTDGITLAGSGFIRSSTTSFVCAVFNRNTTDGELISFRQDGVAEGNISVSGTTVSYNGGHLSRWSQLPDGSKDDTILKGTVLTNLDDMCVWTKDGKQLPNEQLNKMKVSDVEGDTNVAGVFVNWTIDDAYGVDDMNVAMTGDMIIRIADGVVVQKGDLLMSAGDGTAKPQGDDIVRSKTVAKVTSNYVTCTYADGSYCVPCVLMAC